MSPVDYLVIGNTGQVGWELEHQLARFAKVKGIDFPEIDLTDFKAAAELIREFRPKVILNAAAYTAVDKAESEPKLAMTINGIAPGVLAEEAKRIRATLVHYSTDYVFDGTKCAPYTELDEPNPLNTYGRTKLAGDRAIAEVGGDHLIFRTSWVYGSRGRNFLLTIMELAETREEINVVSDQIGSPTWCRNIAGATVYVLRNSFVEILGNRYFDLCGKVGLYNLTSSGITSRAGFAKKIVKLVREGKPGCKMSIHPITTEKYPTPATRPKFSVLSSRKLQNDFRITMPVWSEALEQVLKELCAYKGGLNR